MTHGLSAGTTRDYLSESETMLERTFAVMKKMDKRNKMKYGSGVYCCELLLCADGSGEIGWEYDPRCGHEPIEEFIVARFDNLDELEKWVTKETNKPL